MHADGFVHLLMSLGALGRGRWVKCELAVVGKSRTWKKEMLKNEELTNFPCLKSISPVHGQVCAFADVLGGTGKEEVGQL